MHSLSAGLRAFLSHLDRHGLPYDFDVAMVIGGAAFRHYFFTPDDNHAWLVEYPGEFWREDSMRVENYGVYEAVQGHTGWSSRRWTKLTGTELITLLRYEQQEGRYLRLVASEEQAGGLVESFEASIAGMLLTIGSGDDAETLAHPDLASLNEFVEGLGEFQTLRREPGDVPPTRRHALTGDVFRWAIRHWNSRRETIFEIEAFYASGNRAWEQLRLMTESLPTPLEGRDSAAGFAYVREHLHELALARLSAARFFGDAALVLEHTGLEALSAPQLDALAAAWQASADAIRAAANADAEQLVERIETAHQREVVAFELLEQFVS